MEQGAINPFSEDFFVDHPHNLPGISRIHAPTFNRVVDAINSLVNRAEKQTPADQLGQTILVTAPEAGYGKSHLAARLRDHLKASTTAVSLPLDPSRPVAWPVVLGAIIRQFSNQPSPHFDDTSLFAETGRYLLARLVIYHIHSGNSLNCPEPEEKIEQEFAHLFRSDSPSSILGWADSHSRDLSHSVSAEFLGTLGVSPNELGFWTRLIIDFNWRGDGALEPLRGLTNGEARERLLQWLRLASLYRPVLIIADGLDGFFQSGTAGMEIAGIITGIRETVPRSVTLLFLNQDIWDSVFEHHLPTAWLDRLTGEPQPLLPISGEAASELVQNRLERTSLSLGSAQGFIKKLRNDNCWDDSETRLSPRLALRQAGRLWNLCANEFTVLEEGPQPNPASLVTGKESPEEENCEPETTPEPHLPTLGPTPAVGLRPISLGREVEESELPANPFFVPPPPKNTSEHLTGIDSIINDIRDSGKTVVSELAERTELDFPAREQLPEPAELFHAGELKITPIENGQLLPPFNEKKEKSNVLDFAAALRQSPEKTFPDTNTISTSPLLVSRAMVETRLKEREREILDNKPLEMDLLKVEKLVQKMGASHLGLNQTEERFPSSRTACLRWNVRGQSVLIGFESPRNVYFWNNLLQQSLSSNRQEKITSFSHSSESFDPGLFAGFGFSPSVIRERIDAIEMSDQQLAMLYAADDILREFEAASNGDIATQYIALSLDPLWRRISKPL